MDGESFLLTSMKIFAEGKKFANEMRQKRLFRTACRRKVKLTDRIFVQVN